jgi:hypothetical protein
LIRAQAGPAWALFLCAGCVEGVGPRNIVLVILVRGLAESKESAALMADITRRIYESTQ